MGLSHSPRIVTDGLVFCVDAGDKMSYPGAGTTWTDLSKNRNNGTLTNGPTFNSANGGSIVFDGTNDYVTLGPTNDIVGNSPAAISLSAWFKTSSTNAMYIASLKRFSTNSTLVSITINQAGDGAYGSSNAANHLGFLYDTSGSNHKWVTVNNSTFYGKWTQITATVDANACTLYLNGVRAGQNTDAAFVGSSRTDPSADFTIGAFAASHGSLFANANISQVHVYNRVLSASEVQQNYLATKGRFQ